MPLPEYVCGISATATPLEPARVRRSRALRQTLRSATTLTRSEAGGARSSVQGSTLCRSKVARKTISAPACVFVLSEKAGAELTPRDHTQQRKPWAGLPEGFAPNALLLVPFFPAAPIIAICYIRTFFRLHRLCIGHEQRQE